jgi:hypothetical protein
MTEGYGSLECKIILDIPIANHNRSQRIWIFPITTNKGRDTISFVLRKALEEIHSIHIINETLIRFHDVPKIERDEKKSYHTRKWEQ